MRVRACWELILMMLIALLATAPTAAQDLDRAGHGHEIGPLLQAPVEFDPACGDFSLRLECLDVNSPPQRDLELEASSLPAPSTGMIAAFMFCFFLGGRRRV